MRNYRLNDKEKKDNEDFSIKITARVRSWIYRYIQIGIRMGVCIWLKFGLTIGVRNSMANVCLKYF